MTKLNDFTTIPLLSFSHGPSGQKNSEDTEIMRTWKPNWSGGVRNHLCSVSLPGLSNTWGFTMGFVMIYRGFPAIGGEIRRPRP